MEEKVTKVEKALPNEAALEEGNLLRREGGASVAQSCKPRPPTTEVLGSSPVSSIYVLFSLSCIDTLHHSTLFLINYFSFVVDHSK